MSPGPPYTLQLPDPHCMTSLPARPYMIGFEVAVAIMISGPSVPTMGGQPLPPLLIPPVVLLPPPPPPAPQVGTIKFLGSSSPDAI